MDNEAGFELQSFKFETVTVDARGQVITREENKAFYFVEFLGQTYAQQPQEGIEMVKIPEGSFCMGSKENKPESHDWTIPQHTVTVQSFFMSKYRITQAQWRFVAQLPQVNQELNPNPSYIKGDNFPVEQVTWYDAIEFCRRLSKYTGKTYCLPSEAEWEYACRALTLTPFHFGETITLELANYNAQETTPVGSFGVANAFGLYDMHGNVWEWYLDDWHYEYEGAPTDGSPWLYKDDDEFSQNAVVRGGAYCCSIESCYSTSRTYCNRDERSYINDTGFRVTFGSNNKKLIYLDT